MAVALLSPDLSPVGMTAPPSSHQQSPSPGNFVRQQHISDDRLWRFVSEGLLLWIDLASRLNSRSILPTLLTLAVERADGARGVRHRVTGVGDSDSDINGGCCDGKTRETREGREHRQERAKRQRRPKDGYIGISNSFGG
ncbi:hypothetical protein HHK36_010119 [Tetracentron sinense]|uniref:Uncharacterized protein n=1 Tax=Tetracentron sinense TaxID=13715 RepID=A0A834ZC13_TETSI|nr:hypothetical protein HHK36_010119 [Tetracentron sinense]